MGTAKNKQCGMLHALDMRVPTLLALPSPNSSLLTHCCPLPLLPAGAARGLQRGQGADGAVHGHVQAAGGGGVWWREGRKGVGVVESSRWASVSLQCTCEGPAHCPSSSPGCATKRAAVHRRHTTICAHTCHAAHPVQARELIVMSLPVHDDVMMRMLEALVQVGATAKQRRQLVSGLGGWGAGGQLLRGTAHHHLALG